MLRITEDGIDGQIRVLRVEGNITGPWVTEMGRICDRLMQAGQSFALDLAGVSFADGQGVTLLLELQRRQIQLTGSPPFLSEQLRSAQQYR